MPYIGSPAAVGFSSTKKDRFSGDNSTTGFTLSKIAAAGTDIQVFVDNIRQEPTIAYSVSGTTLTFTEAPPTGTNNVYVIHQHQALGTGTLPPQDLGSTDYIFGDDISFNSDASVINMGLDSEIKITHVHNTGILLTDSGGSPTLQLHDSNESVSSDGSNLILTSGGTAFKLPTSDGTDGQFLKTDASGNLSFATVDTSAATDSITISGSTPTLTIGDAGAEDTKIVFDGNAQDFHIGLDDSADDLVIGLGSTLGTTTHMAFDETGNVRKPLQSAFQASKSAAQNNVSNDDVVAFGEEIFDVNGDFASNVFTAPVTGKYQLSFSIRIDNILDDAYYYGMSLVTSNRSYQHIYQIPQGDGGLSQSFHSMQYAVVADMDANDTASVVFNQSDGTASSAHADLTDDNMRTNFHGYFLG